MLRIATSALLLVAGVEAAAVKVFEAASGASGDCVDHADFVSENLRKCAWWAGKDCATAQSAYGMSEWGQQQLLCHCPATCGATTASALTGCRAATCIKECSVDIAYTTYTSDAGYTEITATDLVNGCTPSTKLANYHPCNHGFQCSSGFCCPNMRVCLTDANTAMTKNDIVAAKPEGAAVMTALFDAEASNTCQVTSALGPAGCGASCEEVPASKTSAYNADWSRCEESGGLPYAAGQAGNGVDGGFDKTLRDCACTFPYLLAFWDNRWVAECKTSNTHSSKCTYYDGAVVAGALATTVAGAGTSYNNLAISIDIPTGGTVADLAGDTVFKTEVATAIKNYLTGAGVDASAVVS